MYIKSIKLIDWKSYSPEAFFEFPNPTKNKSVVLIGAKNGFGKTSLLEAIVLGLYGKDGMLVLSRAIKNSSDSEKSYDEFMEKGFHGQALELGRNTITIEITLESDSERLKIRRKWHFSGSGKHRRDEEETQVLTGKNEEPVRVPGLKPSTEERNDFLNNLIAQKFIPFHLAEFFLFDGERVRKLAETDMAGQVKIGIEGLLGVQTLRELQEDLINYAKDRRNGLDNVDDEKIQNTNREIKKLTEELDTARKKRVELEEKSKQKTSLRLELMSKLTGIAGGSGANVRNLEEERQRFMLEKYKINERIFDILRSDLATALSGSALRERAIKGVQGEIILNQWLASKNQTNAGLEKLINGLTQGNPEIDPPLTPNQVHGLVQRITNTWESLWHPPPTDAAHFEKHVYLTEHEKIRVIDRLKKIETLGLGSLRQLFVDYDTAESGESRAAREITRISGVSGQMEEITNRLEEINTEERELIEKISEFRRTEDGINPKLGSLNAEAARAMERNKKAQPVLLRAEKAETISSVISEAITDLYPHYVQKLSKEMTEIYQKLAHKNVVKKIEITNDCEVRLLGDKGRDIRKIDASAGEEQIFALSLIAAIVKVAKTKFPIVVDTPLGRLDSDHRTRVLNYFANEASEQVIFLSQPDEIHGNYLRDIKGRVGKAFHLNFVEIGNGLGRAEILNGYFPTEAI